MKAIVFLVGALLLLALPQNGFCQGYLAFSSEDNICGPMLLKPISEDVILPENGSLEFEWGIGYIIKTDSYLFRLYKGYATTKDNLLVEKRVPNDEFKLSLSASQFEDGQVYTWVVVQVFNSGKKSDKSFASFRVHKK